MSTIIDKRKFMELAVNEMKASKSEHTHKSDPLVGAVLVSEDGKILGKAHRGNLRVGEHAEFTLIERLLSGNNLENSTLFVTLEPCTKRKPPKIPCVDRIISARISQVYIGIPDSNLDIEGHGISKLLNHDIKVDFFDKDLVMIIREENKDFINQFSSDGNQAEPHSTILDVASNKEKESILSASIDDLDSGLIEKYLNLRNRPFKFPSNDLWDFLTKNGFINKNGSHLIPTFLGILAFGKNPEDFLPQSTIKIELFSGNKRILKDINGGLQSVIDKILDFFNEKLTYYTEIKEFDRIRRLEFPIEALREGIINAIAHRDYTDSANIHIKITAEELVIKSPGYPLMPVTLKKIQNLNAPPFSRNPRVAQTLLFLEKLEGRGSGIPLMNSLMINNSLKPPYFYEDSGYFNVSFSRATSFNSNVTIPTNLLSKLNLKQKTIITHLSINKRITSKEGSELLGLTTQSVNKYFRELINMGLIERKGGETSGPGIYYVLYGE